MITSKSRIGAYGTAASLYILGLGLWSGIQGQSQQRQPFRYEAAAVVKLVPVRVLGADGRPVMNLHKEDFTLYEDGRKKTITEFEVHSIHEEGVVVTPALSTGVKPATTMNRKIFLFLDVQRSDPQGRQKAVSVAQRFLDTEIRPGDEVGLLGFYSMSGFFVREYLTTDIARVRRAIERTTEPPPSSGESITRDYGVSQQSRVFDVQQESNAETSVFIPGSGASGRTDFVPRLTDVAEVFKTIPGNKSLILFSSREIPREIGSLFGAIGTPVYAINTQDWMFVATGDKVKHIWQEHPLKDMAAASGGKYFADINQVIEISRELQSLTGNFYVLGYYVKESWEGKFHKIRVEVSQPDTRVLVQDSYTESKPFSQMTDFEKDVQLLDLIWSESPYSNPLPFPAEILVPADGTEPQACILARMDVGAKTGPPASKSEIAVLLRDKDGAQIFLRRWTIDLTSFDGKSLLPYLILPIPAGACEARIVVRDLDSGEACVGHARSEETVPVDEGIRLFSPLLMKTGQDPVFTRLRLGQKGKGGTDERSLTEFYPLMPRGYSPAVSEMTASTDRLSLILPYKLRAANPEDRPILSLGAKLISRIDKSETILEIAVRDHKAIEGKPDALLAEIKLPPIIPGPYDLEITMEDLGTDRRASIREPLLIK